MTWRDKFRPVIAGVIFAARLRGDDERGIRRSLREAWPPDEPRAYWPYKVWLDEIARQLGRKPKLGGRKTRVALSTLREIDQAAMAEWFRGRQMRLGFYSNRKSEEL